MASVSRRQVLGGALATLAATRMAWAGQASVVSNARILLGDGTEVKGGIAWENGTITAVGADVTGGTDLGGATVYPGMYVGATPLGLYEVDLEAATHDETEGSNAVVPQARVVDGFNPGSALLPVCRVGGILGALVTPSGGLVSGQAAWMRTFGDTVADATIRAPAGVCFNLGHGGTGGNGGPTSRMGVAMQIRDLLEANPLPKPPEEPKKKKDPPPPPPTYTRAQLAWHALRRKETKAIFFVERASDIVLALDLAQEFDLDPVLVGCAEGHLVASELSDAKVPVLLGPITVQPSSFDTLRARYDNAALLHKAGVRFAIRVGGAHNTRDLTTEAGIAVANGLPWEAAIAAISGNGPSFWGLQVGRIAKGYAASFVQTDGDPLQPRTRVMGLWGDGVAIPVRSRQTDLYDRYKDLK